VLVVVAAVLVECFEVGQPYGRVVVVEMVVVVFPPQGPASGRHRCQLEVPWVVEIGKCRSRDGLDHPHLVLAQSHRTKVLEICYVLLVVEAPCLRMRVSSSPSPLLLESV
jgi:hypothetical protein